MCALAAFVASMGLAALAAGMVGAGLFGMGCVVGAGVAALESTRLAARAARRR